MCVTQTFHNQTIQPNFHTSSVLALDNVVGREYVYVNATMRNRRAFIIAVHEV